MIQELIEYLEENNIIAYGNVQPDIKEANNSITLFEVTAPVLLESNQCKDKQIQIQCIVRNKAYNQCKTNSNLVFDLLYDLNGQFGDYNVVMTNIETYSTYIGKDKFDNHEFSFSYIMRIEKQ